MESNRRCSNCGREIYQGASKCAYCGYPYRGDYVDGKPVSRESRCWNCGRPLPPGASKCNDCGANVQRSFAGSTNSQVRKCPRCGKYNPNYLAICPNCGCNLRDYPWHQSNSGSSFNNTRDMNPGEIEQAMEGGMPNHTDAGIIEQINEILHDDGDDMW